jgi:D-alanyl-D-alanine carboxypeptidase
MLRGATAVVVAAGCLAVPATCPAATTEEKLQGVLDKVVAEHQLVPGVAAYVDAPRADLPWTGAAGQFAEGSPQPLSVEDPFRIASVQKVFTGAAILRLVEQGRLSLDQPVAPFLDADQVHRIHVFEGVDYGPRITIRQLLHHTSGLNSHDECDEFTVAVGTGPTHHWTPHEEIETMIDCGDPYFAPGTPGRWHYSDTGFVMLGSVLAKVTGRSYAAALRELLPLDTLGIEHTWHELLEPDRADPRPRAHQYFAAADLTGWDPSFDSWGGGGYVSTVADLARFVRALFEGRVFAKRSTLRLMTESVPLEGGAAGPTGADRYGMGMRHVTYGGVGCWGHTGFWSSIMLYCPSLDLALAATTNQASDEHMEHTEGLVAEPVVAIVEELAALEPALVAKPARARAGRRRRFTLTFTAGGRPVGGAVARLGGRRAFTDALGRARLRVRFAHAGARTARACKEGVGCATARIRVARRPGG